MIAPPELTLREFLDSGAERVEVELHRRVFVEAVERRPASSHAVMCRHRNTSDGYPPGSRVAACAERHCGCAITAAVDKTIGNITIAAIAVSHQSILSRLNKAIESTPARATAAGVSHACEENQP